MFRKIALLAAALTVTVAAFAAFAAFAPAFAPATHAQEPDEEAAPQRDGTFLRGRGVLDAHGDGLVAVKGRIDLYANADGGMLLVKDEAGDAVVAVAGSGGTVNWNGFTVYFGINGRAHVTGSHVAVIVIGEDIDLHAVGIGWAYLKGHGTFEVNNRGPFRWSTDGTFAAVVNDASEPESE